MHQNKTYEALKKEKVTILQQKPVEIKKCFHNTFKGLTQLTQTHKKISLIKQRNRRPLSRYISRKH